MLYLYQSNRLEDLAALLQAVRTAQPPQHPLAAEEIIVQSQGMRRFLNQYLAREGGIAANLHFNLPAALAWKLMRELLPDTPDLNPFSGEVIRWRLLDLFSDGLFTQHEAFQHSRHALSSYLNSSQDAAYLLAGQLADIFDQYLVYRPDWITAWQQQRLLDLGEDEAWQAELWRFLDDGSRHTPHRVALWQSLLQALSADKLPERFFVFGIATLAPMYLQLLQAMAEHCDIHIFALNPSNGYWGNAIDPATLLSNPDLAGQAADSHPLLASLGKQGRDFFDALTETAAQIELPVYAEQARSDSLLHQLQFDIQVQNQPDTRDRPTPLTPDDSILITSAHSPLRELQALKDYLLQLLHQHPDWQAHDIAVLTPDIEPYSPFIEAVFGAAQPGSPALPYSLSDVGLSQRRPLLQALTQTFDLLESRFEIELLLALLENEAVLHRFELSREDLPLLQQIIADLNIHWGLDTDMRREADNLFTWQHGLDRLVAGWLLPEPCALWQNIQPLITDPGHIAPLSRFAELLTLLADSFHEWQTPASVADWAQRTRTLMAQLFAAEAHEQAVWQQIEQALARWQQEAELAGFHRPLPMHTALSHIRRFLSSQDESGFLRGGITFCSMVPMRSLPFKAVCLLGLNDTSYPRNTKAASFDLIARHPRKGDRARRDDDRYLFIETLLSARETLYLSYIGHTISSNEELAPSPLLNELVDTLAAMTGTTSPQYWQQQCRHHPLQAFSRRYFQPDSPASSRSDYAAALNQPPAEPQPFFNPDSANTESLSDGLIITQDELLAFWRNPVRYWLRHALGWQAPYHRRSDGQPSDEPFTPPHEDIVFDAYLAARRHHQNFRQTGSRLNAAGEMPGGLLGQLWQQQAVRTAQSLDSDLVGSPHLPAFSYQIECGGNILQGSLSSLYQHGQLQFSHAAPPDPQTIAYYLQHLIFNAVRPDGVEHYESHWLSAKAHLTLPAIDQSTAFSLLAEWLAYFKRGQQQPLPFFAKTSLAAARAWSDKEDGREKAQNAANAAYFGSGKEDSGQASWTEVSLVFSQSATPPTASPLFWSLIESMLLPTLRACTSANDTAG